MRSIENYKSGQCKQQLRRDLGESQRGGLLFSVETAPEVYVSAEGVEILRPACLVEEPELVKGALIILVNGLVKADANGL